jgi:hypothetical protein
VISSNNFVNQYMPERERGTLPRLFADWPVQQASPPGFASRKSPQVEARLRVNDTRAHAPEAPWQTYFLGAEDIQKYSIGAREQMSCVDANETSRILARPPAARSIKLREIQGHTPGSSRGFAKAASSFPPVGNSSFQLQFLSHCVELQVNWLLCACSSAG